MKNRVAAGIFASCLLAMSGAAWGQNFNENRGPRPPEINVYQFTSSIRNTVLQQQANLAAQQAQLNQALVTQQEALLGAQAAAMSSMITSAQSTAALTSSMLASAAQAISTMTSSMSSMLVHNQSCPVFAGEGTLLAEDSCAWVKLTGQRASQAGTDNDSLAWHLGVQKEVAADWFVGGAFGMGSSWLQNGGLVTGRGQSFDGSLALKHTMGPWLLAAALAVATSTTHYQRSVVTGGTMQSDSNMFQSGLRLRGAYDFAFTGWYVRPRLDVDAYYTSTAGFQEYGPSVGLAVSGREKLSFALAPTIEVGGRVGVGTAAILRPYAAAGVVILPDNNWTLDVSFTGPLAVFGSFRNTLNGPSVLGVVEAGLQLYQAHGFELKADYKLGVGDSFLSQSASLRGAYHF